MPKLPTFEVDKKGLAQLIADRPKAFIIYELVQNAWDEASTQVAVRTREVSRGTIEIVVLDDNPEGFADLTHAYTLFAESRKKGDPEKRGRFNLGEKLVIALAEFAEITTTKGTIIFSDSGREHIARRTAAGTMFVGHFKMTAAEYRQMLTDVRKLLPPWGIPTTFNGEDLTNNRPFSKTVVQLPTLLADDDGNLRPTRRRTEVVFHDLQEGEHAMLYEMGIPVVEIDCGFHVNVQQKVPLNADRDNVTPAYLREIQTITLNQLADDVKGDAASKPWVAAALESKDVSVAAVQAIIKERYGDKVVISDLSDPEGTKMAVQRGYTVLPPRTFTHAAWENVKAAGVLPAGKVTPSPKPYGHGDTLRLVEKAEWTPEMEATEHFINKAAYHLLGHNIHIVIANEATWPYAATYGNSVLTLNLGRLGHKFFKPSGGQEQLELIIHEFAHENVSDHLSSKFYDECCRLGAKLALLVSGHGAGDMLRLQAKDFD